jgi:hypothetical protein
MPKKMLWIALFVLLLSLFIPIILKLTIPQEFATVKFKEPIAEQTQPNGEVVKVYELSGEVTKKDKYITIKTEGDGKELVYTWDQIKSITESRQIRSRQVDEVVDWIEFISKMGIIAAIIIFLVGLYQYQQGQKWKREEFLAAAVKDFMASSRAGNARLMLDALHLYKKGISIQFNQDKEPQNISREEIICAIDTDTERDFDDKAIAIRDCFDAYFNHLERFEHYIRNELVSRNSVYTYLNYQINLLNEDSKLKDDYRRWVLRYAEFFEFPGVSALLKRYKKESRKRNSANQNS